MPERRPQYVCILAAPLFIAGVLGCARSRQLEPPPAQPLTAQIPAAQSAPNAPAAYAPIAQASSYTPQPLTPAISPAPQAVQLASAAQEGPSWNRPPTRPPQAPPAAASPPATPDPGNLSAIPYPLRVSRDFVPPAPAPSPPFHQVSAGPHELQPPLPPSGVGQTLPPGVFEQVPPGEPHAFAPPEIHPIDMTTALALTSGQNPQVNFARWRIREAYARWDAAQLMWLPSLQAGSSYNRHDGTLQASDGKILDVNRSSLQAGMGAGAVGAGTVPEPGLVMQFHLADAIFAPRVAERTAWARQHGARAELQDQMLAAAVAYINTLEAGQLAAIATDTLEKATTLHELTANFARTGQGLQADADRMAVEVALRKNEVVRAHEAQQVASARLAEVLNLDASVPVLPVEQGIIPIDLVAPDLHREQLLQVALANRPELKETSALVAAADEQYRREQWSPFVPNVRMGLSYSGFGGGVGDQVGSFHDRADFDALAVWEVRNLGWGEGAARDTASALTQQAQFRRVAVRNRIGRETMEAAAQVEARRQLIAESQVAAKAAVESYDRNLARIRDGVGLPIEALQSLQALDDARREYLSAIADYDRAQFQLHRAIGWPSEL